jgi:glycosyltransferase involved in cell wall biosynthesis
VLHVVHQYFPAIGGSETLVQRLAEGLAVRGDEVTVFTSTARRVGDFLRSCEDDLPAGTELLNGVHVRRFGFRRVPALARRRLDQLASVWWERRWPGYGRVKTAWIGPHLRGLAREIQRLKPELIVAGTAPFMPVFEAARAGAAAGIPVILLPCLHPSDAWLLDNPFLWATLRRADAVMTLTGYEGLLLRSLGVEAERVLMLGGGVDEQAASLPRTDVRARFAMPPGEPLVLFLGRKEQGKGIRAVVEATVRLWQAGRAGTLVLAGASTEYSRSVLGPWLASLPAPWQARILVRDDIDEAEKWGWLAECDLLAHPSAIESFGLVYLEAWLLGKPVIAGRNGPTAALVRHGGDGLLVGHGAVDELETALARLLDEPLWARRLGEEGRAKALREYTWTRIVDRAHAFYQTAVERHHAQRAPQRHRRHPR